MSLRNADFYEATRRSAEALCTAFSPSAPPPIPFGDACFAPFRVYYVLGCLFRSPLDPKCVAALAPDGGNDACRRCLVTAATAPVPGLIVMTGALGALNVPGCVGALTPDAGDTCPNAFAEVEACGAAACSQCMQAGVAAYGACRSEAAAGPCIALLPPESCRHAIDRVDGSAAACNPPGTFLEAAVSLGLMFCVPAGARDAGVD